MTQITQIGNCKPCADRGRISTATRMMGDETWCENCFRGGDGRVRPTAEEQQAKALAMRAAVRNRERRRRAVEEFTAPPLPQPEAQARVPVPLRPFRYRAVLESLDKHETTNRPRVEAWDELDKTNPPLDYNQLRG